MASYHCSVKVGGKGRAAAHALYIAREGQYAAQEGRARFEDLEAKEAGNMPAWAEREPAQFWQAADEHERANGATYREIEVALPRELDATQRRELVTQFVAHEIGDRHAYQWAIHNPKAALEKGAQPHAHIMYSERTRDGVERDPERYFKRFNPKAREKGGCEKDSAGTRERLASTRERWARMQNAHLARHGYEARVDHRSLAEQGIDRAPERHLGGAGVRSLTEHEISDLLERRAREGEHERSQESVAQTINVSGDLRAAIAHRARAQMQRDISQMVHEQKLARDSSVGSSNTRQIDTLTRDAASAFERKGGTDRSVPEGHDRARSVEKAVPQNAVDRDAAPVRTLPSRFQKSRPEREPKALPAPTRGMNRDDLQIDRLLALARGAGSAESAPKGIAPHAWHRPERGQASEPQELDALERVRERERIVKRERERERDRGHDRER